MKKSQFSRRLFTPSALATAVVLASPALAQQTRVLEEIIVTAEHREASLQETQISLTAFSGEAIQELGISNGLDLFGHVPNMNVQEYQGGRNGLSFSIRGIVNAETLITFDPGVSVYMDNVLLAKNVGGQLDVAELERIEVLRGPQGTLYGRNTMGGAVNYITRKPTDSFEGRLQATVGAFGQKDLRGMVNVPLAAPDSALGELNLRVSAATLNRDGIQDNTFQGATGAPDDLGTINRDVGLVHLQWMPNDDVTVLYSYDITRIDEDPMVPWTTLTANLGAGFLLAPYAQPNESDYPENVPSDYGFSTAKTDVDGHALNITWQLSDTLTLQSITGYREMENWGGADTDGSDLPVFATFDNQRFDSLSQELRLVGTTLNGKLDYTAGAFYWDEEGDVYNTITVFGFPGPSDTVAKYTNEAWAVYGQATYHLSDKLDITAGARYTEEDRTMNKASLAGRTFSDPIWYDQYVELPGVEDRVFPGANKTYDNATWLLSAGYKWTDDIMTYAKISTGFQSGGFNVRQTDPSYFTNGFDDETLTSYEIGLKSQWSDRVVINAAAFFGDYSDKQVNVFDPVTLGNVRQNADVEIWGLELEVLAQLTDQLQAGFGFGHLNSEYTDFVDLTGADRSDATNFTYAPDNTANAHLAYERPTNLGVLKARIDWTYRDEMAFLAAKPEPNSADEVHLFNARLSLTEMDGPGDSTMRVSLWGKNLTDEGYWTSGVNILNSFGFAFNLWGVPRTYGADIEILF